MGPLLYWILFSVLIALLVMFFSYFVYSVVFDRCVVDSEEEVSKINESSESRRLNKYHFDKHDVEDLTRIEGNFKHVSPNLSLTNEVQRNNVDRLLKKKEVRQMSLSNIEEEGSRDSIFEANSLASTHSIALQEDVKKKAKISQSVDDLEFCDPSNIDVLKEIHAIEDECRRIGDDLDYFLGTTRDVAYYEINERLLRLMISLGDIYCDSEELRRKKSETLEYIKGCQLKLKSKAKDVL